MKKPTITKDKVIDEPRWLTTREFMMIYGVGFATAKEYIRRGIVESQLINGANSKKKHRRIKDPHWTAPNAGGMDRTGKHRSIDDIFLLRPIEVAEIVGISPRRVRQLARAGKVEFYQIGHRERRYTMAAVRQILALKTDGRAQRRVGRTAVRKAVIAFARARLNPLSALD